MSKETPHAEDIYGVEFVHARPLGAVDEPEGDVIQPDDGDTVVDISAEDDPHPAVAEADDRVIVTAGYEEADSDRLVIDRDDEVTRVAFGHLPETSFSDVVGEAVIRAEAADDGVDVVVENVETDVGGLLHRIERLLPNVEPPKLPDRVKREAIEGAERALHPDAITELRREEADARGVDDPTDAGKIEVGHVKLEAEQDGDGVVYAAFIEYRLEFAGEA